MAGNQNIGCQFTQPGYFAAAAIDRQRAAGMEDAAGRHVEQRRWQPGNAGEIAFGFGRRQAGDEQMLSRRI